MLKRIVIGTGNAHKVEEIQKIIGDIGIELIPGSNWDMAEIDENGDSYEANAIIKARAYSKISGLPALADDSGLEVDALDGLPGIRSNRLFGENLTSLQKIEELLRRLIEVPGPERTARFISHVVIVDDETVLFSASGAVEGTILESPRGQGGFGYDPVFHVSELGVAMAQLSDAEKNRISHRGKAMRQARDFLLHSLNKSW